MKEREGKFAHTVGGAQLTTETEWPAATTTTTTTHTHSHTGSHVVFFPMARGLLRKLDSRTCHCYSSVCFASWQWWWFQPVRAVYCNQPEHFVRPDQHPEDRQLWLAVFIISLSCCFVSHRRPKDSMMGSGSTCGQLAPELGPPSNRWKEMGEKRRRDVETDFQPSSCLNTTCSEWLY